ncbi:hypothetical protein ACH5RR_029770 [Cinchona calisaya]|uniref:Uncharacterized protein n=1 Tax=Cinchona calisaya TaxID=153742 RepID=A0ABD2YVW3_9GENT
MPQHFMMRKSQVKAHPVLITLEIDPRKEIKETMHETWIWLSSTQKHSFKFDDHEQPVDLVDDIFEEMEVSVTRPSKFDVFNNVVHTCSNAILTKNLEDGENDATNSQARTEMENTIVTWRTPPIQTTSLEKQPLKTFKPPTWPLPPTVSKFHSEEVISNCQREYLSMLWRNLKQKISKTSLEHMSFVNKHATRFL